MSTEQLEYICPQCKKRTVLLSVPEDADSVICPKCEVTMVPHAKIAEAVGAAANAPSTSSDKPVAAVKAKKASTKAAKVPKAPKVPKPPKPLSKTAAAKAAAAALALIPVPDFGDFRCACCGYLTTIAPGASKSGPARCPSCFVKLDHLK